MYITMTPAYGRDYKSKSLLLEDFNNNLDFIMQPQGCYVNKEQLKNVSTQFRYGKMRKTFIHNIKEV